MTTVSGLVLGKNLAPTICFTIIAFFELAWARLCSSQMFAKTTISDVITCSPTFITICQ